MAKTVVRMATTGPWAQRWAVRISLFLIVVAAFVGVRTVLAVHDDGFFELDRDPFNDAGKLGDDWEAVEAGNSSANAAVFVADGEGPTIFTQGGSKDDLDTTNWVHTSGSTPDKDELLNAYAARYGTNLYFGADRNANNGDAVMGFWFFQGDVQAQPDGSFGPDKHEDGDILILSDFTKGGGVVTIRVFRWNGPGGTIPGSGAINGTLDLIGGTLNTPADCVGPPAVANNDPFCATVNNTTINNVPWTFDAKVAPPQTFAPGLFYEGGIDLSFLGLQNECFASFLAETRSSTSTDAVLKDFVGGAFQPCDSGLTTTPKDADGNNIPGTGISIGSGIITVKDSADLNVDGPANWSGTLTFHLCGPTPLNQPYVLCETGGIQAGNPIPVNQGTTMPVVASTTVSSAGKYCWRGFFDSATDGVPDATDATVGECFTVNPVQPTISTNATNPQGGTVLGNPISDTATLGLAATQPGSPIIGGAAGSPAGGTITFRLYGPTDTTCTGTPVYTNTVNVSGNGNYGSGNYTPTLPGVYRWVASYSGNLPNTLSVAGACNDTGEASLVIDTTAVTSVQDWLPNDTATVTSTGSSAINGTLVFQLYTGGTCGVGSGAPVANQEYSFTLTNAASPATRNTTNTTFKVNTAGMSAYSWKVTFTPATGSNMTGSSKCEATSLNINNNAG